MFSSMAQNLGHFLRIFRVLHTVQFSRSFAADSSGRSRSQRQLWYSIISSAVCQQLFISFFSPFPGRSSAPSLEASSIISKGFVNVNHFFHSFPKFFAWFCLDFSEFRSDNKIEWKPGLPATISSTCPFLSNSLKKRVSCQKVSCHGKKRVSRLKAFPSRREKTDFLYQSTTLSTISLCSVLVRRR